MTKKTVSDLVETEDYECLGAKVKLAFLQASLTVPGIPNLDLTLSEAKTPGLKITRVKNGLLLEVRGQRIHVPDTNFKNWIYE